jgi:arginase family enzyme
MGKAYFGINSIEGSLDKNKGCEKAPSFLSKLFNVKIKEFVLTKNDIEAQQTEIYAQAKQIFCENTFGQQIFFGGTHDITFSLFKAFKENNSSAKLIIFDAHADSDEGLNTVSHEDFVKGLITQKIITKEELLLVGVRDVYPSEQEFFDSLNKISFGELKTDFNLAKEKIIDFIKNDDIYFSFDVDVLNEEIMQATHYHPKEGLTKDQAKELLKIVMLKANAIDLVEFNPDKITLSEDKLIKELFSSFFN